MQNAQRNPLSLRRQVVFIVALVAIALGIVVAAGYGVSRLVWNSTETSSAEWGTCHGVLQVTCTNVPLQTIERDSGLSLPSGTRIVSSESTGPNALGQGSIRAELSLPPGVKSPLAARLEGSHESYSTAWNRVSGLDELKARGLRNVRGKADPPLTFVQGETDDGSLIIIVNADDPHH